MKSAELTGYLYLNVYMCCLGHVTDKGKPLLLLMHMHVSLVPRLSPRLEPGNEATYMSSQCDYIVFWSTDIDPTPAWVINLKLTSQLTAQGQLCQTRK